MTSDLRAFDGNVRQYNKLLPAAFSCPPEAVIATPAGRVVANVADWLPGDVLIGLPEAPGIAGAVSIRFQQWRRGWRSTERWTHVAILGERGLLWEAMPSSDVQAVTIGQFLKRYHVVRRVRLKGELPRAEQIMLAIDFLLDGEYRLDIEIAKELGWTAREAFFHAGYFQELDSSTMICSSFVTKVLTLATERDVLTNVKMQLPIDFAIAADFEAQPMQWHRTP